MAINIYKEEYIEETDKYITKNIDYIGDEFWDLPCQMDILEQWLDKTGKHLPKSTYVADIGFSVRKNASGGGGVLNLKMIKILNDIGMEIYFSEYQ